MGHHSSHNREASVNMEVRPMDAFRRNIPDRSKDYEVRTRLIGVRNSKETRAE